MYKLFSPEALGVTGRQSELIELALTYGFDAIDVSFAYLRKQAELRGLEHASRFLRSAHIKVGPFRLPVRWDGDEDAFKQDLEQLPRSLEIAAAFGANAFYTTIMPASNDAPYHENFEFHRERIRQVAEAIESDGFRLGLTFVAPAKSREGYQYQFISTPDALLTLIKTTVSQNLALLVDTWHWRVGGGNMEQLRELSPDQIIAVRMASLPEDASMESIGEQDRLMPRATGGVDNAGFLRVLHELGYEGPVAPFPHPSKLKGRTRDRIVHLAADSIQEIWKGAGFDRTGRPAMATS